MNARIGIFLKSYNLVQLIGWLLAMLVVPVDILIAFYLICAVQLLSALEILFAYKKWNHSSVLYSFLQISARCIILIFTSILYLNNANLSPTPTFTKENLDGILHLMFLVWCVAEIIRYAFYSSLFYEEIRNKFLWLRYNVFIVCYPVGIICELYILTYLFLVSNSILKIASVLIFLIYVIGFPMLYLHLLKQRKIKLSNY